MIKNWKKLVAVLLCVALLAGCGSEGKKNTIPQSTPHKQTEQSQQEEQTAPQVPGEIYDAGEVQALVPEGWTAFPIKDAFSDQNEMEKDAFNICKGGVTELDLYSKPYVRLDYFGPDTEMMKPSKEWYSDVENGALLPSVYRWAENQSEDDRHFPTGIFTAGDRGFALSAGLRPNSGRRKSPAASCG